MFHAIQSLPRSVWLIGLISLINDSASEMLYPMIPLYLASVLMAGGVDAGSGRRRRSWQARRRLLVPTRAPCGSISGRPPRRSATSVVVPPMSETSASEAPVSQRAPTMLAAGPERIVSIGRSRTIAALIREEVERTAKEPTLLALAKAEPERAHTLILAAFELSGGDGRAARASLGVALGRSGEVSDSDWKAARDRLSMGEEIKKRWPRGRA